MNKKLFFLTFILVLFSFSYSAAAQEVGEAGFAGPGGCTTREACRAYCEIESNKNECLTFAVEKGLMTPEEAEKARKYLNQTGPGGCRGDECRDYCEEPAHTEECISFAEENGLIKPGEGARFRKMREIAQKGGPGGCRGEACRDYCEDESHRDECFAFAKENGLLNAEQLEGFETGRKIERAIKESGGPGGCRSERECHQYCSTPARIDECAAFGARHTGKSADEIRQMLEEFNSNDGRYRNGPEGFEKDRAEFERRREEFERRFRESGEMRERMMREGYSVPEGFRRPPEGVESFEGAGQSFQGPGGCDSPEACRAYCLSHPEACGYMPRPTPEQLDQYRSLPPDGEFQTQPTSSNHSRSFLANIWAAFLAPFRK